MGKTPNEKRAVRNQGGVGKEPVSRKKTTSLQFFKPAAKPARRPPAQRECVIDVEKLSAEGRGLGYHDGKPVFVTGVLPGERARVRIHTDKREFAEAQLLELLRSAPQRQPAPCALFGRCGGCQLQALSYAAQVQHKQQVLRRLLGEFGALAWDEPILAAPWSYRHRARLSVGRDAQGRPLLGFKSEHSHAVVAVERCPVLDERLQPWLRQLPGWLAQLPHWQRLREIVIAVDADDRIAMSWEAEPALALADRERLQSLAAEAGIAFGKDMEPLRYAIPGQQLDFRYLPQDFTQVNPAVNDLLVARCMQWLEPGADDRIADFFCGLGNFSLALAHAAQTLIGFESVPAMVERAGANAARAELRNIRFETADLFSETLSLPRDIDKALLDPPRAGAKELCRQLARSQLKRMVYVSCNPHTLARDLGILAKGAFVPRKAALVDMFPQTGHIETVVLLERK